MGQLILWIDEESTVLDVDANDVVCVRYADGRQKRVGAAALREIILERDARLSAKLLRTCLQHGVGIALLSHSGRAEPMQVLPQSWRSVSLRLMQFRCFDNAAHRLAMARAIVAAKLREQMRWLDAHDCRHELARFSAAVDNAGSVEALIGVEGATAAHYYGAWRKLWQWPWVFPGRERRPPRDPLNALLSLGYTLAVAQTARLGAQRGLDPALGFLHSARRNRPALALDLTEPLRPWVDQWVWQILAFKKLEPSHFGNDPRLGCRLTPEGRKIFYGEWHAAVERWFAPQARRALAVVLGRLRLERSVEHPTETLADEDII